MNLLFRYLCILFPPRLPKFGLEDVASTAEYYNRLARRDEATINARGAWIGRISMGRAERRWPFKAPEKVHRPILRSPGRAAEDIEQQAIPVWVDSPSLT
jgi:hypothetical protein